MCPRTLHYFLIFCAFLFAGKLDITANSKNGETRQDCGKCRVNIILDDETLHFHVPIAYQIQHIIYKKNRGKRCSKKKCCKQCGQDKFIGTMAKWLVHKHAVS